MEELHYDLWTRCREFVSRVCCGRDASHGLAHMEKVTSNAILIFYLNQAAKREENLRACNDKTYKTNYANYTELSDKEIVWLIILVAMLHDVADHKYEDANINLKFKVELKIQEELLLLQTNCMESNFPHLMECNDTRKNSTSSLQNEIIICIDAISFSAEVRNGKRWFVKHLEPSLVYVRDCVSDADKMEAIGEDGLKRCYAFTCERLKKQSREGKLASQQTPHEQYAERSSSSFKQNCTHDKNRLDHLNATIMQEISTHYDDKLVKLHNEYIVTAAGKFLSAPLHNDMTKLLKSWQQCAPSLVTFYWPEAINEWTFDDELKTIL